MHVKLPKVLLEAPVMIINNRINQLKDEEKQELIKLLKLENAELKNQILKLEERSERLESKINELTRVAAMPRRGMPWH